MSDLNARDPQAPPAVRPELEALPGYSPVVPLQERARRAGIDPADALKLDANENPFGTLPAIREAVAACDGMAIYPDPLQVELRTALAGYVGVAADRLVAGAGSDELLDLVVRALVPPGGRVLVTPPTFGMYSFLGDVHSVPIVGVPRGPEFALDWDATGVAVDDPQQAVALVMLASPNNPTGDAIDEERIRALLDQGVTVVVDEAYAEFAAGSSIGLTDDYPRLIVMRTFSKWAGLAGLRIGFGVFHPDVARTLMKVKPPYNINCAAEAGALAALRELGALREQIAAIVETRERLAEALAAFPWIRSYASQANFLLCRVPPMSEDAGSNVSAGRVFTDALAEQGVFVRFFADPRLRNCFRLSVPRPDQLDTLIERIQAAASSIGIDSGAYTEG